MGDPGFKSSQVKVQEATTLFDCSGRRAQAETMLATPKYLFSRGFQTAGFPPV